MIVRLLLRSRAWLLSTGIIAAGIFGGAPAGAQTEGVDFGAPPSGQIPILFNDRHVYSKPDKLRQERVLAAIEKGGEILVPLRSLFEQMGATVSYDAASKSVRLTKPGADVTVTVGKPVVVVNGDERPLDVPPEIYEGTLLVPLRVLSEGMGAYVQWLPDRRVVIVRYITITSTPPPTPAVTPSPAPPPSATPTPAPAPTKTPHYEVFVAGDYDIDPIVYNEVSPGNTGDNSFEVKGGFEFPALGQRWMLEGNWHHTEFNHDADTGLTGCTAGTAGCDTVDGRDPFFQSGLCPSKDPGCVTVIGFQNTVAFNGLGQAYVPFFHGEEDDVDARLGIKIADPRVYVGIGGYYKHYNYLGYPSLLGVGFGVDKLPDLDQPFSLYGSVWYYPTISGNYTYPTSTFLGPLSGQQITLSYSALQYELGGTYVIDNSPLYLDFGYSGEHFNAKQNAPSDTTLSEPFAGLGLHF